jgi:hypothetical protein
MANRSLPTPTSFNVIISLCTVLPKMAKVEALIDLDTQKFGTWNAYLIDKILFPHEDAIIKGIPLCN